MKMIYTCGFILIACSILVNSITFLNPVLDKDFPDPCILRASDKYFYVYATEGNGVKIQGARSLDLVNWQYLGEMLPQKPSWAQKSSNWWAPDVQEHGGTFYMYFAATGDATNSMCIGVATSKSPGGPFLPTNQPVHCDSNFVAIDPKSFDDVDGKIYLYWGSDGAPIRVQQLAPNRLQLAPGSSPTALIHPQNIPYHQLVEGAWLWPKNGTYYLFFSGNNCCGPTAAYAVMVARSKSPAGPFEEYQNLVVQLNSRWVAPGHNSIITDDAGEDWIFYHAIDKPTGNYYFRKLLMDKVLYNSAGWPYVSGGTPSTTPQVGPVVH